MNAALAMTKKSSATQATHPGNNFDAIRIAAATMVLVSHHYALTGQIEPSFFGIHSLGGLAVTIFFIISGYLVAASWQRDPDIWRFAIRRFLRIWPALTAVLVLTAYGLGAWVTELPLKEYLTHRATANYLHGLWMNIHFVLPGVFEHNPYARGVNGSLWTIPFEVRCYVILGLAGMLGLLKFRSVFLFGIALYMLWFLARSNADLTGSVHYGRELSAFFLAGAAMHVLERHWNRSPTFWALGVGTGSAIALVFGWRHTALLIALPFVIIYSGTRATHYLRRAGCWGDPSYGIYLFAFPIQQSVILYTWPSLGFGGTLALALLFTTILAYASWHLLEKQALKLKPSNSLSSLNPFLLQVLRDIWSRVPWNYIWPIIACFVGLRFILLRLDGAVLIDPAVSYLPSARAFLDEGWSFLLRPESYFVTPLAYLWPAVWGVDPTWIRIGNMGLWVGCVWFMWRTCLMLSGPRAAAIAMLLMLSPELMRYSPTEMTEPIFLFGLFGWMHAIARVVLGNERSWGVIVQGAFMLAVTLLSRPVLQLIAPAALLAAVGVMVYQTVFRKDARDSVWRLNLPPIAWSLGLGLILPIALVIKNGIVFGLWGLGTGSGIGLYLGTHPLFQGGEPGFLGFDFDVNLMAALASATGHSHSMAADSATRQAAIWHLQSMSFADAWTFFMRKLWWWLAHHPAQIETHGSAIRKLRFFELLVVLFSLGWLVQGWLRRSSTFQALRTAVSPAQWTFGAFLLVMFLAMLAQLMPILHNSRYSSALLDPWLIPLTAFGLALMSAAVQWSQPVGSDRSLVNPQSHEKTKSWRFIAIIAGILILTFGGYNVARKYDRIGIDPAHMGETLSRLEVSSESRIQVEGMHPLSDHVWTVTQPISRIRVSIDQNAVDEIARSQIFNAMWETRLSVDGKGQKCKTSEFSYQTADGRILQPQQKLSLQLPILPNQAVQRLVVHANHEMRPREPGSLRIQLRCPVGTEVEWHGTWLLESRHAWSAAAHVSGKPLSP